MPGARLARARRTNVPPIAAVVLNLTTFKRRSMLGYTVVSEHLCTVMVDSKSA